MQVTQNGNTIDLYEAEKLADYVLHVEGALIDQLDIIVGEKALSLALDGKIYELPKTSAYANYVAVVERQNRHKEARLSGLHTGRIAEDPMDWEESWKKRQKYHFKVIDQWSAILADVESNLPKEQLVRDIVTLGALLSP